MQSEPYEWKEGTRRWASNKEARTLYFLKMYFSMRRRQACFINRDHALLLTIAIMARFQKTIKGFSSIPLTSWKVNQVCMSRDYECGIFIALLRQTNSCNANQFCENFIQAYKLVLNLYYIHTYYIHIDNECGLFIALRRQTNSFEADNFFW